MITDINIKVVAYTFPAICLVLGFLLLFFGDTMGNSDMSSWGGGLIVAGILLFLLGIAIDYAQKHG